MISAGNQALYQHGRGCGSCYQVLCMNNKFCSGSPIRVTITDECPGTCNDDPVHFDFSGFAFGSMAMPGQDDQLRNLGRIDVAYRRFNISIIIIFIIYFIYSVFFFYFFIFTDQYLHITSFKTCFQRQSLGIIFKEIRNIVIQTILFDLNKT